MSGTDQFISKNDFATDTDLRYALRGVTDKLHVLLMNMDYLKIDRRWNAANVRSSYWRLYFNDRAGPSIDTAAGLYRFAPRRIHFVPAWVHFRCHNDRSIRHFYIHFDVVGLPGTAVRELFPRPVCIGENPHAETLARSAIRAVRDFGSENAFAVWRAKALVYFSFSALLEALDRAQRARFQHALDYATPFQQAIRYIDEHLSEPLPNRALAKICHYNTDHFIRVFGRAFGQTPAQYVLEQRVVRAARQLTFSRDAIERIAEECGFANRFHFSRVFAQRMGVAPATYRKTARV